MKNIRIAAMVLLFSIVTVCSFAKQQHCDVTQSKSLVEDQIQDDGWVEIGYVMMKSYQNFQCADGSMHSGYDISVPLQVKEFSNGVMLYRILYCSEYYAVSTELQENGKIHCSVDIDYRCNCNRRIHKLRYEFCL